MRSIGIDPAYIRQRGRSATLSPYPGWNPRTKKLNGRKFNERPFQLIITGGGRGFGKMPYKFSRNGRLL